MTDYSEKFEKMRIAGKLASQTLDMLTENIKSGISTATLINLDMNLFVIMVDILLLCFIEVLKIFMYIS